MVLPSIAMTQQSSPKSTVLSSPVEVTLSQQLASDAGPDSQRILTGGPHKKMHVPAPIFTQVIQHMQIPLSYVDAIIENISRCKCLEYNYGCSISTSQRNFPKIKEFKENF